MVGWRWTLGWMADGSNVVVLVEMETCWPILVRLNLASDGEHARNDERFRTSAGGRGSGRGVQKSRNAALGGTWAIGDQAGGTNGIINRRADLRIGLDGEMIGGLKVDADEISLHRALTLPVVHDEQKLPLLRSCRRRVLIIILNRHLKYINYSNRFN